MIQNYNYNYNIAILQLFFDTKIKMKCNNFIITESGIILSNVFNALIFIALIFTYKDIIAIDILIQ